MPYPKGHTEKTREAVLASAYKMFISKGYDATSIDAIMADCALTRGAFYAHFESKSQLYTATIQHAASQSGLARGKPADVSHSAWIRQLLATYLDKDSSAKPDWPCPLAFFATDIAHREPAVRSAYTQAFASMSGRVLESVRQFSRCDENTSLSVTAMLIGAVAVARTMDDSALRERLLIACEQAALAQLAQPPSS